MNRTIPISAVAAGALSLGWAPTKDPVAAARIPDAAPQRIEVLLDSGAQAAISTQYPAAEVTPSPKGRYVAALVTDRATSDDAPPSTALHIWERTGKPLLTVENVHRFGFSPYGDQLAIIVGRPYEGALGFQTERVEIIVMKTRARRVARGLETARDLAWIRPYGRPPQLFAEVDREDGRTKIVRYDPAKNTVHATKLLGLQCSPDGEYYFLTPRESEQAGFCGTGSEHCVRAFSWKNEPVPLDRDLRRYRPMTWADNRGHQAVFTHLGTTNDETVIVDLANGRSKPVKGKVDDSWVPRAGRVILRPSGKDTSRNRVLKLDR